MNSNTEAVVPETSVSMTGQAADLLAPCRRGAGADPQKAAAIVEKAAQDTAAKIIALFSTGAVRLENAGDEMEGPAGLGLLALSENGVLGRGQDFVVRVAQLCREHAKEQHLPAEMLTLFTAENIAFLAPAGIIFRIFLNFRELATSEKSKLENVVDEMREPRTPMGMLLPIIRSWMFGELAPMNRPIAAGQPPVGAEAGAAKDDIYHPINKAEVTR